jgi:hypothetical protein
MEFSGKLDTNIQLNHGVLVEQWLESLVFQDQEHQEVDREPLVTSAERVECSLLLRSREDGTERLISTKEDMQ